MSDFNSYSQYGEDYVVYSFFKKRTMGILIDIGAFDGYHISNSYALYKKGWETIAIEANPIFFDFLIKNRPDAININKALVKNEEQKEVVFQTEPTGLYSGVKPNTEWFDTTNSNEIRVPASTLNQVAKEYVGKKQIDCISIDVEGTEEEILSGFDFNTYKPTMLIIEANDKETKDRLVSLMKGFNYTLSAEINVNLFFLYKPSLLDIIRLNAIRVNCIAVKTLHPIIESSSQKPFKPESRIAHVKRMLRFLLKK
ncbi:FkbM family methyltransferase [Cytophaga aurantiaca]|uniref:FkbM family methyltransferase n=1 Tax=Cytophaga aurantiaca TaxID=29530 RepID=UPI00037AA481|nr:FkbM family methyltransferase [Cytophaga aurantiaca]